MPRLSYPSEGGILANGAMRVHTRLRRAPPREGASSLATTLLQRAVCSLGFALPEDLWSRYYTTAGWGAAQLLESRPGVTGGTFIDMLPSGQACVVVWTERRGAGPEADVYYRVYR